MAKNWTTLKNKNLPYFFYLLLFQLTLATPFITFQPNINNYTLQFWFHAHDLPFKDLNYQCIARFPFSFSIKSKSEQFPYFYFNETITLYLNEHDEYPDGLEWIPFEVQIPFKPVTSILTWTWENRKDSLTIFPNFSEPPPFSLALLTPNYALHNPFHAFSIPLLSNSDSLLLILKSETPQQLPQLITIQLLQKQFDPLNPIESYYGLYSQNYRISHSKSQLLKLPLANLEEGYYLLLISYIDRNFKEQVYNQYPFYIVDWDWKEIQHAIFTCHFSSKFPTILKPEEIESYIEQVYNCLNS